MATKREPSNKYATLVKQIKKQKPGNAVRLKWKRLTNEVGERNRVIVIHIYKHTGVKYPNAMNVETNIHI